MSCKRLALDLGHAGVIVAALVMVWLAPPARGRILLAPIDGGDAARMVRVARAAGALVIGPGSMPASMVVDGARAPLVAAMLRERILVLAASGAGCDGTAR